MKELLILKDIKGLEAKKGKSFKKPSGIDFASLLFDNKNIKNTDGLLALQNTFKAKNSILNKNIKPSNSNIDLAIKNLNTTKQEQNMLANLLQNPKKAKIEKIVQNAKEINEFLPKRLQISDTEIMQDVQKTINDIDFGKELLDDLNFTQVLEFLEILKQDKKDAKIDEIFTLKNIINNKTSIENLANTKSVHSLVELAKEYKLGIKEITYKKISNNEYNEEIFKKPFPKLFEQNFFSHAANFKAKEKQEPIKEPIKKITLENLLNDKAPKIASKPNETKVEKTIENTLKTGALNDLLSEVAKKENKDIKVTQDEILKNPKEQIEKTLKVNVKEEIKEIIKDDVKAKNDEKPMSLKEMPKDVIKEQNIKEQPKMEINPKVEKQTQDMNISKDEIKVETSEVKETTIEKPSNNNLQAIKMDFLNPNKELTKEQTKVVLDNFTRDFKEEVEKFKAPSHRVSINLNPKELGEINVTMIARGNNLHINLNSANQNTLNLFIANQQEFKNSLVNMGFTGIAMNFGDRKEGQQQEQNQKNARKKYEEIEELEATSDMPSGINAVLYRYL